MTNKSFKIFGQLDISNIISNTEKLRNTLESSLDTTSFQKIEKKNLVNAEILKRSKIKYNGLNIQLNAAKMF